MQLAILDFTQVKKKKFYIVEEDNVHNLIMIMKKEIKP